MNVEITTAGKKAEKIGDIPASVVVITRTDLEQFGYQSLEEILENIPGLFVANDLTYTTIGVRGFWTSHPTNVMILINGVSHLDDIDGIFLLKDIPVPVESIDRIEVVRGPMSVMYGAGAFFGVINIITDDALSEKYKNLISISAGSQQTKKAFLRVSGGKDDFRFTFNACHTNTDGLNLPWND
ncbi:MAG: TonB-dependent receptor, partial [bacterium]|nr:TonB-dependent receptor [bacterium]